jgi:hypothetical protein
VSTKATTEKWRERMAEMKDEMNLHQVSAGVGET